MDDKADGTFDGTILDGCDEGISLGGPEGTTDGNFERVMTAGETYPQMGGIKDMFRLTVTL